MRDYVLAVGGTGARCVEAITYLAAAGLLSRRLHVLLVDPSDQNNGNGRIARQVIERYHELQLCTQPVNPKNRRMLSTEPLNPGVLFQPSVNHPNQEDSAPQPYAWRNPNQPDRRFEEAIDFDRQTVDFQDFLRLFYEDKDLRMPLNVGYRGRTSVGAVALKIDLDGTRDQPGGGLRELIGNLQEDLLNGYPKVFVAGSVFGGTGASALPTLPPFFKHLGSTLIGPNAERIRYGSAMLIPYFSFPKGPSGEDTEPVPDSDEHLVATKAALLHYAHVRPEYQHTYLVGAPAQYRTATVHSAGDEGQANAPHYAEFVSALAAVDFFRMGDIPPAEGKLHFANDVTIEGEQTTSWGIQWNTLPASDGRSDEIRRRLVSFTTFCYFYKNFLHRGFIDRQTYLNAPWYRDNFKNGLTLSTCRDSLIRLNEFADSYLRWLHSIGMSGESSMGPLFRWEGLLHDEVPLCAEYLGHLTDAQTGLPKFLHEGYDRILKRLDAVVLEASSTRNAMGLFIYLLYQAASQFCKENYRWS